MVETHSYPTSQIDSTALQNVGSFKYLGSTVSNNGPLEIEINERMNRANNFQKTLKGGITAERYLSVKKSEGLQSKSSQFTLVLMQKLGLYIKDISRS